MNLSPQALTSVQYVRHRAAATVIAARRHMIALLDCSDFLRNLRLHDVSVKRMLGRVLWNFRGDYCDCKNAGASQSRKVRRRNLRPSITHKSPRKRTVATTAVRPSGLKLKPFTGLFAGGDVPSRERMRCRPVAGSTSTMINWRSSVSLMPTSREPCAVHSWNSQRSPG